jgi:hypothetical protein
MGTTRYEKKLPDTVFFDNVSPPQIKAYYNLQKELQMTLISISACDPRKISKQEELAYVQHSARGLESLEVSRVQNGI